MLARVRLADRREDCAIDGSERGDAAFDPGSGWLVERWTFACSIG